MADTHDSVAVEVGLELALAPGIKNVLLGRVGRLGKVAGDRSIGSVAGLGSRGIACLSSAQKIIASSAGLLAQLFGGGVAVFGQIVPDVVSIEIFWRKQAGSLQFVI